MPSEALTCFTWSFYTLVLHGQDTHATSKPSLPRKVVSPADSQPGREPRDGWGCTLKYRYPQ